MQMGELLAEIGEEIRTVHGLPRAVPGLSGDRLPFPTGVDCRSIEGYMSLAVL